MSLVYERDLTFRVSAY